MNRPHPDQCKIESRARGVLVVRVRSYNNEGETLPDAVFTFYPGDPQYEDWYRLASQRGEVASRRSRNSRPNPPPPREPPRRRG